ncbi:MAG: type II toxin-antitoxin system RelE/ParE family toxin [Candidatus Aenigmarchaeota archaeon]|nr:type II toxin-antitoxin system RelE/ParE family toxin [Candidatus Aenigmarchaeota archaeon]
MLVENSTMKFLESLDRKRSENIRESLRLLKESPYPDIHGDKKEIKGTSKSAFRLRIGDYRAFYIIEAENRTVKVTEIMTAEAAHKKYGRMD